MRVLAASHPTLRFGIAVAAAWLCALPASAQDANLKPTFGAVRLKAGFLPDPFVKQLTAGGPLRTKLGGVQAHVAQAPDFQLIYQAGNFPLTIHVQSAADTTLHIKLPDGSWVANDDGPNNGLNPLLRFARPSSGRYDIWVGTFGKELASATLFITERPAPRPQPEAVGQGQPGQPTSRQEMDRLWQRARELNDQGKSAEALTLYENLLARAPVVYGANSLNYAAVLNNLGEVYGRLGQFAKAEPLLLRALQIHEVSLGKDHPRTADVLMNLGNVYRHLGQYAKAQLPLERSLHIYEAKLGSNHPDIARALNNLALLYQDLNQNAKAEPMMRRAVQIADAGFGNDHPQVADYVSNLAILYAQMGSYAKAEPLYERSLGIREAKFGKDHPLVAASLNNLAGMYVETGQYTKARPLYERSLEIRPDAPAILHNLGNLYHKMAQYDRAESLYQRSLKVEETQLGPDHPNIAYSLNNLAILHSAMGQYAKAEKLYQRSLQICEAKFGKDHPRVASALNNLAVLYRQLGQGAKAEPLCQRSLQIREASLGQDHLDVAQSLTLLAVLHRDQGKYAQAEPLYQRSLAIAEAKLGKDHPEVASVLHNQALLYEKMDRLAEAEPLYLRSLRIREAAFGKDHPTVAESLHGVAGVYRLMGQYAKAEQYYRRSLAISKARLGKDHPNIAYSLSSLAQAEAQQGDFARAVDHNREARAILARHLARSLPTLSEAEQLRLLQNHLGQGLPQALSLGLSPSQEARAASAEWLLNGKALAHQALAEQYLLARDAQDPASRRLLTELQETRTRLAVYVNRPPQPGREAEYQKELQGLRSREQKLAEDMARAVGRPYRADPWVTLQQLRAKLAERAVYVEIARIPVVDFKTNKLLGPHYVAWITPPGNAAVEVMNLGEAEPIDQLVEQTRKTLIDSARSIPKVGEIEASAALQKPLQELSAKVLHPLLPALAKYEEWIVCPDGALWLTPWNALLLRDGKFAVEKHLIRHVVSGRDLVLELPKAKAELAYLFADPDYDLSPGKVLEAAGGLRGLSAGSLLGQRLRGVIGTWKVSFEFLKSEVLIRDEEDNGRVAGKGTWKQQGSALTIRTSVAVFEGTIAATEIRGQRSKRNDDGTRTRDTFRMDRPRGDQDEVRSAGGSPGTLPKVRRLPGTAAEAEAVRPKLRQWLGQEPKMFLEGQASEAMLKAIKNPRVLVLATHGYFLPTQEVEQTDRPSLELGEGKRSAALFDKKGQPIENPLLRCGLLLAGCNKRAEAKAGEDDGILTGLEIVGLDLRGCELVVLSACETGLGEVRNGEGVAGLRQAFQLAGAKAVLASLWQVPDRETALLMNAFYSEIVKGRSQAEALRQAQLQRIAARQQQFGAAHPFFWAAFALTSRTAE